MSPASRGLQGRWLVPPCLSVGKRKWIKIAKSRGACPALCTFRWDLGPEQHWGTGRGPGSMGALFLHPWLAQPHFPKGCQFPGATCCSFAGLLWVALPVGCWAEPLPPLHASVTAEAVSRLQEVQHLSL